MNQYINKLRRTQHNALAKVVLFHIKEYNNTLHRRRKAIRFITDKEKLEARMLEVQNQLRFHVIEIRHLRQGCKLILADIKSKYKQGTPIGYFLQQRLEVYSKRTHNSTAAYILGAKRVCRICIEDKTLELNSLLDTLPLVIAGSKLVNSYAKKNTDCSTC